MVITRKFCWVVLLNFQTLIFSYYLNSIRGQPFDYPIANLSSSWINSVSAPHLVDFADGSRVSAILLRGTLGPRFACGFFCKGNCEEAYLFAIFIVQTNSVSGITSPAIGFPQVVWSANRNNPVRINATLQLQSDGDLVLKDVDGALVWSTNTSGRSVAGLNLTDPGNLVLFDVNKSVVWQSFDHPTDSLVPGQKLVAGEKLTSSVSATNFTRGLFSLAVADQGLVAFIESQPPLAYFTNGAKNESKELSYVKYLNRSLALYVEPNEPNGEIPIPEASSAQYVKLGHDGHLRVIEWGKLGWNEVADPLTAFLGECNYPMVCGKNGICSNGQCSCPKSFTPVGLQPDLGCREITPLTCEASQYHKLIELEDTTYFDFRADIEQTGIESCKQACLNNCSCKAAIFRYGPNSSAGDCYLPSQIFSLMVNEKFKNNYNSSANIKVQIVPNAESPAEVPPTLTLIKTAKRRVAVILVSTAGALFLLLLIICFAVVIFRKKRRAKEVEEDFLDQVPGMPTRFSYEQLKAATDNFSKKLGEGGFGSVFEGTLSDGLQVAVKCLDGLGQIKKSFLAEVETIGSIHHVNLVRLIGFCAEKSHRLLAYEYMCNGSLDKWIYRKNQELPLEWKCRRKIVHDIAKGLVYLHEDCRQKIIHLDIKPQNILLDENFNAKVSDFGLSKLIDRDQSQVVTTMRGTPGYLAPEWLSSVITEKVDVYSFGIVILETMCGRKNFDRSEPEEGMHLVSLLKQKAEEGKLLDLVDKNSKDMQLHGGEVVEMIRVAAWCLQSDFQKRPSMSVVVKVLEGAMKVADNLDYSFSNPPLPNMNRYKPVKIRADTPLLPSVLSGPR